MELVGDATGTNPASDAPSNGVSLTPRELEVLRLVAEGRSNHQIADELLISARTVSVHVSHILGKLSVSSRVEAAAVAHRLAMSEDVESPAEPAVQE